ncbi:protein of unknown function [Methylocella tundrae]|uniref:Uncharacterized protein n=1 Tax=Methylocella tundrae TaxID=227605 RepID=A0A4U8YZY2_METTU|nr:protein of unknown function [Methylocella tundrae]
MTPSSTPPVRPGETSSHSPTQSPQSACATGPISVNHKGRWYQLAVRLFDFRARRLPF